MDIKFDFDDILITPSSVSNIDSRNEINIYDENDMLPLFTAPMFDVVSDENINTFIKNGIYGINPRKHNNDYDINNIISYDPKRFVSFGLVEFDNIFLNTSNFEFIESIIKSPKPIYVLIDIANGHMTKLITSIKSAKKLYGSNLVLMVGNIANPETYHILSDAGADFIRVGIGNGCFISGTKVLTNNGLINIEDIDTNYSVKTHKGNLENVISTSSYIYYDDLVEINGNISTEDHKYYVVNKKYENIINDENIHNYAEWIEAKNLDINNHFLLELE